MGTFGERIDVLQGVVGDGVLSGKVVVNQVYARAQHESNWVTGPMAGVQIRTYHRGGGPKYLEAPLFSGLDQFLRHIAKALLDEGPQGAMEDVVDHLIDEVARLAPVWLDDLRHSASGEVTSDGRVVYNKPSPRPRLSREEIKTLARMYDHNGDFRGGA